MRTAAARLLLFVGALALLGSVALAIYGTIVVRRGFSARDEPSALEAVLARAARTASIPERTKSLKNPLVPTDAVLAEARAHWADHCASCHANNGSGDTQLGRNMYPRAPDMRKAGTQELTDGELYGIIQNGIRLTGMPAWGQPGDDDLQSWALVAFIRHLPWLTPAEEAEMKALNPKSVHEMQEREQEDAFLNGL